MKKIQLIIILIFTCVINAQNVSFSISETYINQFGKETDLIGFNPLFKLDSDYIHNKQHSEKIKHLPKTINKSQTAYGFIFFTGINSSFFNKELTFLVENYMTNSPTIFIDRNGNLDFTDDGEPLTLKDKLDLKLTNENDNTANFHYQIAKSQINKENENRILNRFSSKFPNSSIVSAVYWLTNQRLNVKVSKEVIDNKPITIFLLDNSVDGLFTFQTNDYGDRILIIEGKVNENMDLTSLFRQAKPIDNNTIFELYGKRYYIKSLSKNGKKITITETEKETVAMYKNEQDVSSFAIKLLDGISITIKDLIKEKKYLLIDIGGTWCGGCISQESTIKKIYKSGKVEVIGLFDHDTPQSVRKYVKKHNILWPVALVNSTFKDMFKVNSYPTYILISSTGKLKLADINSEQIVKYLKNN